MTQRFATTPFGGGSFSASDFQVETWVERRRAELAKGGNETGKVDKFQLLRALTEARLSFRLGDRTIAVLDALLTFHQSRELDGTEETVVFPSNRELGLRTRGMADRTLRYHLRALVTSGLLLRRDSPNGKRYSVKDDHGEVEQAYGFDLAPFALKATEIFEAAERARSYWTACRKIRGEIMVHLRDIRRIIITAYEERRAGDWKSLEARLDALSGKVGRTTPLEQHEERCAALVDLRGDVENLYLSSLSEENMAANDGSSCRHIQNSKTEPILNPSLEQKRKRGAGNGADTAAVPNGDGVTEGTESEQSEAERDKQRVPPVSLQMVVEACPEMRTWAGGSVRSWTDLVRAGDLVRSALGISPDAMRRAQNALGDVEAAVVVVAMLERHEDIRSPGGYLRSLTQRAETGRFTVRPMIDALLSVRLKERSARRE